MVTVALAWLRAQPTVTAPIIGVRNMRHLEDNLGAAGWQIPGELKTRLLAASSKPMPYPYRFQANLGGDRRR